MVGLLVLNIIIINNYQGLLFEFSYFMSREITGNYSYSIQWICPDQEIALQNALRYKSTYTVHKVINEEM